MSADAATLAVVGTIERGYERVRDGFVEGQRTDEGGAQLCVYRYGKKVVDLWGGQDTMGNRPYAGDALTVIMSCTKGVAATAALMLVERGRLDPEEPVTRYWPEFGQAGKEDMRVHHLFAHTAGLNGFDPALEIGPRDLLDFGRCANALARMEPLWKPGTASMYHAITYGYLLGELVRRIDGRSIGRFVAEEISAPLELDLWIGLPAGEESRVARQYSRRPGATVEQMTAFFSSLGVDLEDRIVRTMINAVAGTDEAMRLLDSREGHAAEIPAGNALADARSLARMYAATIGEIDGVRLLNKDTVARARLPRNDGLNAPEPLAKFPPFAPQRFGLGYMLTRFANPMLGETSFGHDGAGGRVGFADPESGFAVAYLCNNMSWDPMAGPDPRWVPWLNALLEMAQR
jgi:CubicO group peptidase (beta-lactamase class C family)